MMYHCWFSCIFRFISWSHCQRTTHASRSLKSWPNTEMPWTWKNWSWTASRGENRPLTARIVRYSTAGVLINLVMIIAHYIYISQPQHHFYTLLSVFIFNVIIPTNKQQVLCIYFIFHFFLYWMYTIYIKLLPSIFVYTKHFNLHAECWWNKLKFFAFICCCDVHSLLYLEFSYLFLCNLLSIMT